MQLYKIVGPKGEAINGGGGSWFLPNGKSPGEWMPEIKGDLKPCQNGYHLLRKKDVVYWLPNQPARFFVAQYDGELITSDDKCVVRNARLVCELAWNDRAARLFACDCAWRVLKIYEKQYPKDKHVRKSIQISRKVAKGELPKSELGAAGYAARAAAWDAARDAAWAAALYAAKAAAWAAAKAAAWAAARDAAWAAARDAAWAAARDAAWDAARDAAWDAARDAAWAAARDAARDAEREWQTKRLFDYLEGRRG